MIYWRSHTCIKNKQLAAPLWVVQTGSGQTQTTPQKFGSGSGQTQTFGGPKCLVLGEQQYFVWDVASQSRKWIDMPKIWKGHGPCPPWLRLWSLGLEKTALSLQSSRYKLSLSLTTTMTVCLWHIMSSFVQPGRFPAIERSWIVRQLQPSVVAQVERRQSQVFHVQVRAVCGCFLSQNRDGGGDFGPFDIALGNDRERIKRTQWKGLSREGSEQILLDCFDTKERSISA